MIGIILKVIAAWLIGYLAGLRFFDTEDKPIWGLLIGIMFGPVIGAFGYGVLDSSGAESFSQYFAPVSLIYSGAVGSRIGSIIFSVFATVQTIREIVKSSRVQALPGARNG